MKRSKWRMKKENILNVDGVAEIVLELSKLTSERDQYKEKLDGIISTLVNNTELNYDKTALRVADYEKFIFLLQFLAPQEYANRLKQLQELEAQKEAEKEANNE